MAGETDREGIKERLSRQGEEALGRVAEELAANPVVSSAIAGAFEARERAVAAQEAAMGALGIPSAADIERLTRRVRSVSQRLEGIEDALDRLDDRLRGLDGLGGRVVAAADARGGDGLDRRLDELKGEVSALKETLAPPPAQVPRAQERLAVPRAEAPSPGRRSTAKPAAGSARKSGGGARKPAAGSARKSGSTRKAGAGSARKSGGGARKPAAGAARKRTAR
ncbi:MAG: hypothetical protein ACR2IN_10015 [Thermoleophilaceae bacterium]